MDETRHDRQDGAVEPTDFDGNGFGEPPEAGIPDAVQGFESEAAVGPEEDSPTFEDRASTGQTEVDDGAADEEGGSEHPAPIGTDVPETPTAEGAPVSPIADGIPTDAAATPQRKRPMGAIIAIACIVAVILAIIGVVCFQGASAQQSRENYLSTMNMAKTDMLNGAAKAETLANKIVNVWNSAIFDGDNRYAWDADIKPYFSDDFNTSLQMLFSDSSTQQAVSEIESSEETVKGLMSELSNPPEDLDNAYDTLLDLYDEYMTLTKLATSPSGTLQTYSSSFRESDTNFMNDYNRLETQIPSE